MSSHLGNMSARNVNSQLTWIQIFMLSAVTVLGIFHEKVSSSRRPWSRGCFPYELPQHGSLLDVEFQIQQTYENE